MAVFIFKALINTLINLVSMVMLDLLVLLLLVLIANYLLVVVEIGSNFGICKQEKF